MKNSLFTNQSKNIQGIIVIPADKSISHRALILGSIGKGRSSISNLLESEDVLCTLRALQILGAKITKEQQGTSTYNKYIIESKGFKQLNVNNSKQVVNLYMGNSGTSCRLLAGVLSGMEGNFILTGDSSLSKRPMDRIVKPLIEMGAKITANQNVLPLKIHGSKLNAIAHTQTVASAQVKSCIMLASLFAEGKTQIQEEVATRDHTENMLKLLGVDISKKTNQSGTTFYIDNRSKDIISYDYVVPADLSSASFFIALALITENSKITMPKVNINPLRAGLLKYLKKMGAKISIDNIQYFQGEPVADITVQSSTLKPVNIQGNDISTLIDELPILFVVAANTEGVSNFYGIEELRYKESDRLNIMANNLSQLGVKVVEGEDFLQIYGNTELKLGNVSLNCYQDHRIAMSFLIMGSRCKYSIEVLDTECINTSFPNFRSLCQQVGYVIVN